jgi:hypothetical protein
LKVVEIPLVQPDPSARQGLPLRVSLHPAADRHR